MNEITAFGHVNDCGEMKLYNAQVFKDSVKEHLSQSSVQVTVTKVEPELSNAWRSYYFAFVIRGAQEGFKDLGDFKTLEETDYFFRDMFLSKEWYDERRKVWIREPHTLRKNETKVSGPSFKEYCEQVIIWCNDNLGVQIPYIGENQEQ